jgi:predicted signal transduction protein with EAL and GGDEF domain
MGHTVGDRLLCTVADRLRNAVRAPDVVGRLGGDEFTVLLTDVDDAVAAMAAAQRVAAVIREPIMINGIESIITPSIGVALAPPELEPQLAENLLRDADIAMYRAKEAGRARIELFAESVSPSDRKSRLQLVSDLHRAVDRREIVPFYQPVVDLGTGAITKFEALARWRHPSNEIIMPADFIGLAEDSGLILPIGVLMMQQVCEQLACWNRERRRYGREPLSVSINLSPRQLEDSSIIAQVAETLTTHSVDPSWITFELTESALMRDTVSTIATMRELRQLGIRLAIDDFGTGYSSLSYLKRFPVEALKIDRSFTDGLGQEPEDTAIVAAVISLAHALNLYAIAEGLETRQQLDELQRLGCDAAQGFLIGVPLPASDLADDPACSFDFAVLAR